MNAWGVTTACRSSRLLALLALLGLAVLFPGGATARTLKVRADSYPAFEVGSDFHELGQSSDLYLDLYGLSGEAQAARIVIRTPPGFGVELGQRANYILGGADIYSSKGHYRGELEVADPAALDADPATAGCADGTHAARWWMVLNGPHGELSVPIAVDPAGKAYTLTLCLSSLVKLGIKADEFNFETRNVFRNPSRPGNFRFSALFTPAGPDGAPDPSAAFEMRANEPIPEDVGVTTAAYAATSSELTISGAVTAAGRGRVGINVHLYAGATRNIDKLKEVGVAVTAKGGAYRFTGRVARAPAFVLAYVRNYGSGDCSTGSAAPGGCASETTDGAQSHVVQVKASHR